MSKGWGGLYLICDDAIAAANSLRYDKDKEVREEAERLLVRLWNTRTLAEIKLDKEGITNDH